MGGRVHMNGAEFAATRSRPSRYSRNRSGKKDLYTQYFSGDGKLGGQTTSGRRPTPGGYVPPVIQHGTFWGELVVQELRILW